jgi:LmbE family N-acetylglucosaminyl deacetylase
VQVLLRQIVCAAVTATCLVATPAIAQVRPVYDTGAAAMSRVLQRLQTTASVMHTGAHPDDEDSALLAYLARHQHARTTYLSLTRGGGGQNAIGAELSEQLGVIRSEELLQARTLDGAEQLFTRAVDYGYSKYLSEARKLWDEEVLLDDMVRAIRKFRPLVIVSRWNGSAADGHGHHQFAGYLTPLAFAAAADPDRFPDHFDEGLTPWQAQKFYVSRGFRPDPANVPTLLVDTGKIDPVLGRSYYEIAMEGRSQQKTQQMGSLELRGPQDSGVRLVEAAKNESERGLFDGIDTSISGIARFESGASRRFRRNLDDLESTAAAALDSYDPLAPQELLTVLAEGLRLARETGSMATSGDAVALLNEKSAEFEQAVLLASGVSIDSLSDAETVVPGGTLRAAVRVYIPEGIDVEIASTELIVPDGWSVTRSTSGGELANEQQLRRSEQPDHENLFDVGVSRDAQPTQPYWLEKPVQAFMFDWGTAGTTIGQPFRPPIVSAELILQINGLPVTVTRAVEYRLLDRVRGEIRRPLNVVPAISVVPGTELLIMAAAAEQRLIRLVQTVSNNTGDKITGSATFDVPAGWSLDPDRAEFSLPGKTASATVTFELKVPGNTEPGQYSINAVASSGGEHYRQAMQVISYPHIQTHRVYRPSSVDLRLIDVQVADVRVGYVMGSGDGVPEAIRRLGLEVTLLDDADLATGDLSRFDTIIVGIRASQARPAFVANNARLLDFAHEGGTLIVQYQQSNYVELGLPPFSASMDTNVRVVDETASVTILEPDHPVFNFPNRIVAADFDGWVQERNGYTFAEFDRNRYTPLLESHDEGEQESVGGMVYAELGRGKYLYSSYAWFRQLPNGVPGAYRIFANMLSLSKSE